MVFAGCVTFRRKNQELQNSFVENGHRKQRIKLLFGAEKDSIALQAIEANDFDEKKAYQAQEEEGTAFVSMRGNFPLLS